MKNAPASRRSIRSAAIVPTLWLMLGCFGLATFVSLQAQPSWWSSQGATHAPQVVTNNGMVTTNYITNDFAVANQGQVKQFTVAAVNELNATLTASGGAGPALTNLVYGWHQDYLTNGYFTNTTSATYPYKPSDLQAVNVGQLKYVGKLVWNQLTNAGYAYYRPSWLAQTNTADYNAANLGELKQVFYFDIVAPQTPGSLTVIYSSTQAILTWTDTSTLIETFTIQYSIDGGATWANWPVPGNLNGAVINGLTLGANYSFRIAASNPSGSSAYSTSDAPPTIALTTPPGAALVP